MRNKSNGPFEGHETIRTKHVFIEDDQVFLKRDSQESALPDNHGEVWYPINFQWEPLHLRHLPLKKGEDF